MKAMFSCFQFRDVCQFNRLARSAGTVVESGGSKTWRPLRHLHRSDKYSEMIGLFH